MNAMLKMDSMDSILRKRGLEPNGRAQRLFTAECARYMDQYTPMQTGTLKNTRVVGSDYVAYQGPYARYLYYGNLMLAPNGSSWAKKGERKHCSGKGLTYHGAPMRGKLWDRRMLADKKAALVRITAKACGGICK